LRIPFFEGTSHFLKRGFEVGIHENAVKVTGVLADVENE
jgi:hypothetical protein